MARLGWFPAVQVVMYRECVDKATARGASLAQSPAVPKIIHVPQDTTCTPRTIMLETPKARIGTPFRPLSMH